MINYLEEAVKDLNVIFETRGDNAHIAVIEKYKYRKRDKNVFTYWPHESSIELIILRKVPRTTYHSIEEMKKDKVAERISDKYNEMI